MDPTVQQMKYQRRVVKNDRQELIDSYNDDAFKKRISNKLQQMNANGELKFLGMRQDILIEETLLKNSQRREVFWIGHYIHYKFGTNICLQIERKGKETYEMTITDVDENKTIKTWRFKDTEKQKLSDSFKAYKYHFINSKGELNIAFVGDEIKKDGFKFIWKMKRGEN